MLNTYYKDRLNTAEQRAYEKMCEGIEGRSRDIVIPRITDPMRVIRSVNYDHPEYFYVNWLDSVQFVTRSDTVTVRLAYLYHKAEVNAFRQRIREIARGIAGISDYGKALGVHDWFVKNITYDHSGLKAMIRSPAMFSAVGPIVCQKAVCEGVSKLACCLLREKNVDCGVVIGYADNGEPHAWNAVTVQGETLYTDITYDMGLYRGYGQIGYRYFNLTREAMARDHSFLHI